LTPAAAGAGVGREWGQARSPNHRTSTTRGAEREIPAALDGRGLDAVELDRQRRTIPLTVGSNLADIMMRAEQMTSGQDRGVAMFARDRACDTAQRAGVTVSEHLPNHAA